MRLAYLNTAVESSIVPSIDDVPPDVALQWAKGKKAYFFRYDQEFNWQDATKEFGSRLPAQVTKYSNALFSKGRGKEVPELLRPFLPALAGNGIAHYHNALGLQLQGRTDESLTEYREAIRLAPDLFFAYYNRANLLAELNRRREACADITKARSLDSSHPGLESMARSWCQ
jgi:tetratricopeptide (TPR) repeat protein